MATSSIVFALVGRDRASNVFRQVGRSADGLASRTGKAGALIKKSLAVGAVATAGLAVTSLKTAGDFEKSMNRVKAVSQATGKDFTMLRDQAKEMGRTTAFSAKEAADAQGNLAMAGLSTKQIFKALPSVIALASTEQMGLADAASIATNVMTGYGKTVDDLAHVTDVLAKASINTNAGVSSIGEAMKYAAPVAQKAGIKFEQATAAIGLMSNAGIQGSMAGTALRGAITRLLAPTKQVQTRLDKLGVTVRTSSGQLLPLDRIIDQLGKSGATTGDLMTIFGQRAGPAMAALVQKGSPALDKLTRQLENSGGTAEKVAKIQMQGLQGQLKRLKGAWEDLLIEVGDTGLLNVATKAVHGLTTAASGFASWINTSGIPAAQNFGRELGELVPVDTIKARISTAKTTVGDFLSGLSGNGTVKMGIPRVDKTPEVMPKSSSAAIGKQIHDAIGGGVGDIDWGQLGTKLGAGLSSAIGWLGEHAADMTKKFAKVLSNIDWVDVGKSVGGQAIPFAIGFINNLFAPLFSLDFWKKHWLDTIIAVLSIIPIGRVAGVLGKLVTKIPFLKAFAPLLKSVEGLGGFLEKGFGKAIVKPLVKMAKSFWGGLVKGFTTVFPETAGKLSGLIGKLAVNIVAWSGRLVGAGERLVGGLGRGILNRAAKLGEYTGKIIGYIVKPFAKAGGWLVSKGTSFVTGLKNGIVSGAKDLGGWAWRTAGRPAVNAFAKAGSWLLTKGRSFVTGLKNGVVAGAKGLGSWFWKNVGSPAVNAFAKAGTWLKDKGGQLVSGLVNGTWDWLKSKGNSFLSWAGKIKDKIVGAIRSVFDIHSPSRVMAGLGGHIMSGLWHGMLQGKSVLESSVKGLFKSPLSAAKNLVSNGVKLSAKWMSKIGAAFGLGDSSASGSAQQFAQALLPSKGWGPAEWPALKALWQGESGWNYKAMNPSSGAYGIPQALPASKMASAGSDWKTNAATQIRWGMGYIKSVYGSPSNAYAKWKARSPHWYEKGTGGAAPGWAWVGEKGPELINLKGGEAILNHRDSVATATANGIKLPGYASGTISNAADRQRRAKQRLQDARDDLARAKQRHKGVAAAEKKLEAAQKELKAANIALANAQRSAKTSISNTIKTGLLKTLQTGTSAAIGSAIKSLATKLLNAGYTKTAASIQNKGAKLQTLAGKRASVQSQIAAANAYATDQASTINDFLSISGTSATSVGSLISQMGSQQKTAGGFVTLTKSLKQRGASKELLAQLAAAGPGSQLATILGGKDVTTKDIAKLNSLTASGGKLATSFGKDMADLMYDTGKHAGEGFLAGLKATEKDLQKQINKLANDLVKQIKKALKIKSPSVVMRDQVGKNVALGMAAGMDVHSHLVGASAQRLADTAAGVSTRRVVIPSPSVIARTSGRQDEAAALLVQALRDGSLGGNEIHVHVDDGRMKDLIRVEVRPMIKASEKEQAYRGKVGLR